MREKESKKERDIERRRGRQSGRFSKGTRERARY
jgi:hypothetical protein